MSQPLPIAILSPHGGTQIPPEVADRIALTQAQIFNECDAYADQLYDFGEHVLYFEKYPFTRAIIDVNRPMDRPYHNRMGDGAIKQQTSYGAPVYLPGREPDDDLKKHLIREYWLPWHRKLAKIVADPRVKLVIDGHSMAALGPSQYDDPGTRRPRVLVGNYGDTYGEDVPGRRPASAPPTLARFFAERLGESLADIEPLTYVGKSSVLNRPFWGGYQIEEHGGKFQPWMMIEVNRALYIGQQDGDSPIVPPDAGRLAAIRDRLWQAIEVTLANIPSQT